MSGENLEVEKQDLFKLQVFSRFFGDVGGLLTEFSH